jgi:hypothetical protein
LFSSRLFYGIVGAVVGGGYGVLGLGQSNSPDLSGTEPLYILAFAMLVGALIGLQLHETRSWSRHGEWGTIARWVVAFASTAATVGAVFIMMGNLTSNNYLFALGASGIVGFALGVEAIRWQESGTDDASTQRNPQKGLKKYREATSPADAQSRFVWVDNDGSIRELTPSECEFLATPFRAFDGGRPYVKSSYDARTPDNRLQGFLERKEIPRRVKHR